jgi:hypothetical protein
MFRYLSPSGKKAEDEQSAAEEGRSPAVWGSIPRSRAMNRDKDILASIRGLQLSAPVDISGIARALGLNVWESKSLPDNVAGKLSRDAKNGGAAGFSIIVRAQDSLVRKRFTVAHEIGHFLLHQHLIQDEIVDDALYRSNLSTSMEAKANGVAADLLMPWHLLDSVAEKRASELAALFQVSRQAIEIRLTTPKARRIVRRAVSSDRPARPPGMAEFRALVEKWRKDTRHRSSLSKMIAHQSYQRIMGMGPSVLPLLLRELSERPDHWLVALNAITGEDPAPAGSTFNEAVGAWLTWGRERAYLK